MVQDADDALICTDLAARLQHTVEEVERAYGIAARNVRLVLRRQHLNAVHPTPDHPLCRFLGEDQFAEALGRLLLEVALFTLARVYDECHVALCKAISASRTGRPHHEGFRRNPCVDLQLLTAQLGQRKDVFEDQILLEPGPDTATPLNAVWKPVLPMSFDNLPRLASLSGVLPGEQTPSREYAGVGGGGGSDIISASILGHLLRRDQKKMNLLISTRTWATGSQGKKGSKLGVKREVYNADEVFNNRGAPLKPQLRPIAGTFRVKDGTYTEGRDLETIPLQDDFQIFIVLDQGESVSEVPEVEKVDLRDQLDAVLMQAERSIETVIIVDTGGDVFGADASGGTTPDQDFRVQKAMSGLSFKHNLVTAVVSPGVDAPNDAPKKAYAAGGKVYKLTEEEREMLLDLLVSKYKMDGSDPSRFGKTTLALQARLRGIVGWTSLDLPAYVVDTWDNPWNSFVYIRDCMSDIVLMPTTKLLPLIDPAHQSDNA